MITTKFALKDYLGKKHLKHILYQFLTKRLYRVVLRSIIC